MGQKVLGLAEVGEGLVFCADNKLMASSLEKVPPVNEGLVNFIKILVYIIQIYSV